MIKSVSIIISALTTENPENSSTPSTRTYTDLDASSGTLTNHHGRFLHMTYPEISRAILVATL